MADITDAKPAPEEFISVPKSVYDELKAKAEANEKTIEEAVEALAKERTEVFKDTYKKAMDEAAALKTENACLIKEAESYRKALAITSMEGIHSKVACLALLERGLFARIFRAGEARVRKNLMF